MGVPLKQSRQNSNLLITHARHMKFQDMQIWKKHKIWWYQNEGILLKQGRQNSKFNHLCWIDEIFRIGKNKEKIKFDKI